MMFIECNKNNLRIAKYFRFHFDWQLFPRSTHEEFFTRSFLPSVSNLLTSIPVGARNPIQRHKQGHVRTWSNLSLGRTAAEGGHAPLGGHDGSGVVQPHPWPGFVPSRGNRHGRGHLLWSSPRNCQGFAWEIAWAPDCPTGYHRRLPGSWRTLRCKAIFILEGELVGAYFTFIVSHQPSQETLKNCTPFYRGWFKEPVFRFLYLT